MSQGVVQNSAWLGTGLAMADANAGSNLGLIGFNNDVLSIGEMTGTNTAVTALEVTAASGVGSVGVNTAPTYGSFQVKSPTAFNPWGMSYLNMVQGVIQNTQWLGTGVAMANANAGSYLGVIGYNNDALSIGQLTASGTASTWLTITSTGSVGIGTTSPGSLLDIGSQGTTLGTLQLESSAAYHVVI